MKKKIAVVLTALMLYVELNILKNSSSQILGNSTLEKYLH